MFVYVPEKYEGPASLPSSATNMLLENNRKQQSGR